MRVSHFVIFDLLNNHSKYHIRYDVTSRIRPFRVYLTVYLRVSTVINECLSMFKFSNVYV